VAVVWGTCDAPAAAALSRLYGRFSVRQSCIFGEHLFSFFLISFVRAKLGTFWFVTALDRRENPSCNCHVYLGCGACNV
jgi:hypothetical protein